MRATIFLLTFSIFIIYFTPYVLAQVLSTPTISSPATGSSFSKGSTFTLTSTVSCSDDDCNNVQFTANLPSGLSTSSANPQNCGKVKDGNSCTKSWTTSANSVGTYSITTTASSSNAASKTSSAISVTVTAVCGDSVCEGTETTSTCSQDCGCPTGQILCNSVCTTPTCTSNPDCNDNNAATTDTCNNANTCSASCSNTAITSCTSGDSVCPSGCTSATDSDCPVSPTQVSPTTTDKKQLVIEILSPASNQKFRRGESLLLKAKISSDGSPTTGSDVTATVFSSKATLYDDGAHNDEKRNDGIYGNTVNITKTSQGESTITIQASQENYLTASATRKFFVESSITIFANKTQDKYSKGDTLTIPGNAVDFSGRGLSGIATLRITYKDSLILLLNQSTSSTGYFAFNYQTNFGDPEGAWTGNVTFVDENDNSGFVTVIIPIEVPSSVLYQQVKFLSPVESLEYSRGEKVKVAVEVVDSSKKVSGSNVSLKLPYGDKVQLKETAAPGVYSTDLDLGYGFPTGNVSIVIESKKEVAQVVRGGGANIPVEIKPAALKVDLLSPTKTGFVEGETVKLSAKVLYPDGTTVKNAVVKTLSPSGEEIFLQEGTEAGTYVASYQIKRGDEGSWQVSLLAEDVYQNSGSLQSLINIGKITIFFLLLQYWWAVAAGASPFAAAGYYFYNKSSLARNLKKMRDELVRIKKMKKEAQIKYFKQGNIDEGTYENMMKEYTTREVEIKSKLSQLEKRKKK